jgi:uncharacterized membrane protein YgcG
MTWPKPTLTLIFLCALVFATWQGCAFTSATGPGELNTYQAPQFLSQSATQPALETPEQLQQLVAAQSPSQSATQPVPETPEQLQQLVAPIALYPDELVAQILAAATYPEQVVEADRWMQQHTELQGEQLAQEVNQQPWDPSVKALTQFPSVLENMDKNLSWTSSLGDAYINQQQDVMNAIQVMRQRAQKAGNLKSTSQQQVAQQGQTIVIEPADPQVVYVPEYNPWVVYGAPVVAWPGWYAYPGLFLPGPGIVFGAGFGIGLFGGFGWGWHHWGADWHHHTVVFNHNTFISQSHTFINRNHFFRRGPGFDHSEGLAHRDFEPNHGLARGFGEPHGQMGMHSGAFGGFDHGGNVRSFAFRGRSSFGGGFHGGGFHAGGFHDGGFHGGGFHGGGGGHR